MAPATATTPDAPPPVDVGDALLAGFQSPPMEARPRTWWHWMNGNVTQDGIARDLQWMADVGLGGIQAFDASLNTPQIVDERLVYMTPGWRDAFRFAAREARRHGLEIAIAASPGWSETGGPWVAPENGMKKLVWSEQILAGGRRFLGPLTPPPTTTGPYQNIAFREDIPALAHDRHLPEASGRIAVLAVPVTAPPLPLPQVLLANGTRLDSAPLADDDLESGVRVPLTRDLEGEVQVHFAAPVTVRSMRIFVPGIKLPFRGVPIAPVLEARIGETWQPVVDVPLSAVPTTVSFDAVTAGAFRIRITGVSGPSVTDLQGAPGAVEIDIFQFGDLSTIALNELRFSAEERTSRVEEKAGFQTVLDYHQIADRDTAPAGVASTAEVIDLTDRVGADGRLDWTPPAGRDWRVISFGWSLTGKENHPAPAEATGLEVDKFDAAAVRAYLETYLGMYRSITGQADGSMGIDALLTDSIEVGLANWTPRMEAEFAARRGYALRPWLPALTGVRIGSAAQTEAFLYDWRRTLAELLADAHYGTIATVAREHGLIVYGEALEDKRPLLGDDLSMRSHADVPMAALWTWQPGNPVRTTLIGDMRGAASVAHVYGRRFVAAESMTAANAPWAFAPRDLRRYIDFEFVNGINRPVIHTSVHQPVDDRQPGLSLMIFGQYFNRHESWAGMARPWVDYMARSSWMLQQGVYVADVAFFHGEEAPITAQYATSVPAGRPRRYAYDYVNADMLATALRVEDGMIVSAGGTRYRALFLGDGSRIMTLATLRRIAELARAGASIIGPRPDQSPSLNDDPAEFATLAQDIWARSNVVDSQHIESALADLGLPPDFAFTGGGEDADIPFLHRRTEDADIYFLANRRARPESIEARFRVSGRAPQWWDAVSGTTRPLSYRQDGPVTVVPLSLGAEESGFVVFQGATDVPARTIAAVAESVAGSVSGPWTVQFQSGRGAPAQITMNHLAPLNEHADFGVRHFSGVASYVTSFVHRSRTRGRVWIDLGEVGDVAEVLVNGVSAGISWWAPNRVEIGHLLRRGENRLEVRVANLWVNRLIGDRQEGAEPVTFTAAPTYRSDAPLRRSGLIGPVEIVVTR